MSEAHMSEIAATHLIDCQMAEGEDDNSVPFKVYLSDIYTVSKRNVDLLKTTKLGACVCACLHCTPMNN